MTILMTILSSVWLRSNFGSGHRSFLDLRLCKREKRLHIARAVHLGYNAIGIDAKDSGKSTNVVALDKAWCNIAVNACPLDAALCGRLYIRGHHVTAVAAPGSVKKDYSGALFERENGLGVRLHIRDEGRRRERGFMWGRAGCRS